MNTLILALASLWIGIAIGMFAAFLWLRFSNASPLRRIKEYLTPEESQALRLEVETLKEQLDAVNEDYRVLSSHPASLVLTASSKEILTHASPAITRLTGFNQDQLLKMHLVELFTPESGKLLADALDRIRQIPISDALPQTTMDANLEIICQDGSQAWVKTSIKMETAEDGSEQIVCQLMETTALQSMEAKWDEQRQDLKSQIDQLAQASQQSNRFSRSLASLLSQVELENPERALEICSESLQAFLDVAGVLVAQRTDTAILISAVSGLPDEVKSQRLPLHQSNPLFPILDSSQAVHIDLSDTPFPEPLTALNLFPSCTCLPLKRGGVGLGVVAIFKNSRSILSDSQLSHTRIFANLLELILSYGKLLAQQSLLRVNDVQTRVLNRSALVEIGKYEIERSHRYNRPLSLILVGIDHLQNISDQYGQAARDQVLFAAGRILRANLRDADLVGRSGEDEFAILLPETPLVSYDENSKTKAIAAAAAAAERIRRLIAGTPLDTMKGTIFVTASAGVAEAVEDCHEFSILMHRAEAALLLARQLGSNRIQVWLSETESP